MPGKRKDGQKNRVRKETTTTTPAAQDDDDLSDGDESNDKSLTQLCSRMSHKRTQIREAALQLTKDFLSDSYALDICETELEPLLYSFETVLLQRLKKGKTAHERVLACEVMSLIAMWVGPGPQMHGFAEQLLPTLLVTVENNNDPMAVRCAAVRSMAILSFMCDDPNILTSNMTMFYTKAKLGAATAVQDKKLNQSNAQTSKKGGGKKQALVRFDVLAEVVQAWGVVATLVDLSAFGLVKIHQILTVFQHLLSHPDFSVRCNAGKNVALLWDTYVESREEYKENAEGLTAEALDDFEDDVMDLLGELSETSTKGQKKKTKAQQKRYFREILGTVEEGKSPSETLKLEGQAHTFEGWDQLFQLQCFRQCLRGSLPAHMLDNDMIRELFDVTIVPKKLIAEAGPDKRDMRLLRNTQAKLSYIEKQKARKAKMLQNSYGYGYE